MIITVPAGRNSTNNILSEETMIFWQTPVSVAGQGFFFSLPPYDSSVAEIIAKINRLAEYLSAQIEILSEELHLKFTSMVENRLLQWTDSKVALVEFIYAPYAGKCFNNGNTSLKDIASAARTLSILRLETFIAYSLKTVKPRRVDSFFLIS